MNFPSYKGKGVRSFLRVFPDPRNEGGLRVVGETEQGPCVWQFREGIWEEMAQIADRIERPFCHQAADGALWIHSWDGVIYSVTGKQAVGYTYSNRVDKSGHSYTYYNPLALAESAGGTMGFHSHFGSSQEGRVLDHLLFFRKGAWEKIAYGDEMHPGGICFPADDRAVVASEKGLTDFNLAAAPAEGRTIAPPGGLGDGSQRPCFLTRLTNGTLVTLWCPTGGSGWTGKPAYPDGSFSRIVEYDGTKWTVIPEGVDPVAWDFFQYIRPFTEDGDGGFWLGTAGGGLMYRSPKGQWQRLDWRVGVPSHSPLQMRMGADRVLWVVDRNGTCAAVDTQKALSSSPAATAWQQETLRSKLRKRKDGLLCALSDEQGGSVVTFTAKGKEFNKIPVTGRIPLESVFYMTLDSEDGVWLFSDITQRKAGHFDGKTWTFYEPDSNRGLPFHCKEIAFQAQLPKGETFRIGTPDDCYYPSFTRDGRIVFKNEWGRVCYYDGKQWHAPYGANEIGTSTLSRHPFFHEGKVTICHEQKTFQMDDDQWTKDIDDRAARPWKEVDPVPYPFEKKPKDASPARTPPGCPIEANKAWWRLETEGWSWVGGGDRMACSPGTGWIAIPLEGSPLAGGQTVTAVLSDAAGRWFFELSGDRPSKYALYQAQALAVENGQPDLGTIDKPFTTLKPPWRTARDRKDLLCRYRIDDGDWSALPAGGEVELGGSAVKGKHRLDVEIFGRNELIRGPLLSYGFEVAFDGKALVDGWIRQLGASSHAEREKAAADLKRFGAAAIPALKAALAGDDPEVVTRAREILQSLEPPAVETKAPAIRRGLMNRRIMR